MAELRIVAWLRALAGLAESMTVYVAACMSSGGLALLASHFVGANPSTWFAAGFCLPIGPLYFMFTSDRSMESKLRRWRRWKDEGLLPAREYDQLRKDALSWYKLRRFGRRAEIGLDPPPEQVTQNSG